MYTLWNSTVASVKGVEGLQYFVIFQKLPAREAGNSLGLGSMQAPMVLCLLSITWNNAQDDDLINRVAKALINDIEQATQAAGLFERYKYLNYAASWQNPIDSYGSQSVQTLRGVSAKYDHGGFFQTQVPGGFKLANTRIGSSSSSTSAVSTSLS